jgi:hypothetical protein
VYCCCCRCILHFQQYSRRLNLFFFSFQNLYLLLVTTYEYYNCKFWQNILSDRLHTWHGCVTHMLWRWRHIWWAQQLL